ncbi:MAG: sugar phosphate isomerase/epimerase family protein [Thermogemmata sp.]|jgi:sugar phosphate isomerase/epimerase|uniref:Sugar phosphate isomerase/epimerase n=1 Tax=Thermogemmata fonticola TaxID=2755323 RepID=A0A7V9AAW7_9BACT|nr:sugar phosphate isomerase/epimerase family protein [Thermogemmata fonticola]MBA2225561.1 sugar phosphate isomerase/epimerase [Thermogemmata fonticola]GIW83622.1 MAG: xylose isomerase [Gemmataceae bacterium]
MFLGYNTNGFAHHRLEDAIDILADLGYAGVALTLDVHHLDPFADNLAQQVAWVARRLSRHRLRCVVETGARFLLDPRRKHQPTLLSGTPEERAIRLDFLKRCVDIAADLGADCVSLWSGAADGPAPEGVLMLRLVDRCERLAEYAVQRNVRLAFEPEPGMFIDTLDRFAAFYEQLRHPALGLTLDIGHLVCQGEVPVSDHLRRWKDLLWNVHIEDMRRGQHEHLFFGEGEVDFADVFAGLRQAEYGGGVYVELSRHSYDAVATAQKAYTFLRSYLEN